ncbi:YicC/YloC family endoribonuclease [Phaeobacter sp. HF9A]|uniref:YicC/YloC family endoribonuclease n=1 Tax=Phaeobacter sp. HF9A TaxID=2721561 RepID=UPI00142FC0A0|nr:YicC/YloC family endoribonuclease [Phaeobacter sp. HF9A]NIZ12262.1 YicC family protein [Phaeobacter sp. HF9A]
MTLHSMTGFASGQGSAGDYSWTWDIRSVNAKGLDVRTRTPEWLEGLETELKKRTSKAISRGNVSISLRLNRAEESRGEMQVNAAALNAVLAAVKATEEQAEQAGLVLAPMRATDLLAMRGVLEFASAEQDPEPLVKTLLSEFDSLLAAFVNMRQSEGQALSEVLSSQLSRISELCTIAAQRAEDRLPQIEQSLRGNLARILQNSEGADSDRVAQELAMLAVKADVTEELDRLAAHVKAAQRLLQAGGPVGRKLDFLMQEFNREANTLCSKAQNAALTDVGLELKTIIDQMREQVQNIE